MTNGTATEQHKHGSTQRSATLVWIDSREAFVVRWLDGEGKVERFESDVPPHHRSTGHVRHDPGRRQGGGGVQQTAVEGNRLEHLARFVATVADHLPADDDLLIIGPGTVRDHLERHVVELDSHRHATRAVACRASRPLTMPQLIARLRAEIGADPPRKPVARRRPVVDRPSHQERLESRTLIEEIDEEI